MDSIKESQKLNSFLIRSDSNLFFLFSLKFCSIKKFKFQSLLITKRFWFARKQSKKKTPVFYFLCWSINSILETKIRLDFRRRIFSLSLSIHNCFLLNFFLQKLEKKSIILLTRPKLKGKH